MKLPSHVKLHTRSNSLTPTQFADDMQMMKESKDDHDIFSSTKFIDQRFMKRRPTETRKGKIFTPQLKKRNLESTTSLPALKAFSEYSSLVSDSSVFEGNDSALASSLDIELDANGQPLFDNMSSNGNSVARDDGEEGSEEVPMKNRMARPTIKKKSTFLGRERNSSVSSDDSQN